MELPFDPAIPLLGLYPKNPKTSIQKNLCTPMFIAVLFTLTECWKQSKCPSVNEWIRKLWYILHRGILCSGKREGIFASSDNMDGAGEYFAKRNKPGSERQIPYNLTYKRNLMNKTGEQNRIRGRETRKEQTANKVVEGGG